MKSAFWGEAGLAIPGVVFHALKLPPTEGKRNAVNRNCSLETIGTIGTTGEFSFRECSGTELEIGIFQLAIGSSHALISGAWSFERLRIIFVDEKSSSFVIIVDASWRKLKICNDRESANSELVTEAHWQTPLIDHALCKLR